MIKEFKVGIIGAGKIVENSHLPVLKNMPGISVEWLYDHNTERCQLLSTMYSVPTITDWQTGMQNIDLCLITIPYGVRLPYLDVAASLQKFVYVEKPFALSVKEHMELTNKFLAYELAIGFQRRVYKIVYELRQLIKSNILGQLKSIDFVQGYFSLKGGGGYLGNAELSGGGIIVESAIHSLDQILLITDATDVVVESATCIQENGIDYESKIKSIITTPYGNITVTSFVSTLQNLGNTLTLRFQNGNVQCQLSADAVINIIAANDETARFDCVALDNQNGEKFASEIIDSFYIFWEKFLYALNKKKDNITSANNSLLTTKWIERIYERFR